MKINISIHTFYPAVEAGGSVFSSFNTCKELSKLGIESFVSTANIHNSTKKLQTTSNTWHKLEKNINVKYYDEYNFGRFSISFRQIFFLWQDLKLSDIIHIQGLFNSIVPISLFYSKLMKKKVLLTPHGTLGKWCLTSRSNFKSFWINYLIKPFISNIIWHATAEKEKNEILDIFPYANVIVIPNGINYQEFKNSNILSKTDYCKKFINRNYEPNKIIISMGRLQKIKGFDILIDAFLKTLTTFPNSILLIAGSNEGEEENLRNQITKIGLENNVFLIGSIEGQDKLDFFTNADLFCLPSHNENFGIVYTESLASGTPIIASKNTPWSEVEDFDCGRWVENSIEETSKAMNEVLAKNREVMKINSLCLAQKYDWANIAKQFKKLFEEML